MKSSVARHRPTERTKILVNPSPYIKCAHCGIYSSHPQRCAHCLTLRTQEKARA